MRANGARNEETDVELNLNPRKIALYNQIANECD